MLALSVLLARRSVCGSSLLMPVKKQSNSHDEKQAGHNKGILDSCSMGGQKTFQAKFVSKPRTNPTQGSKGAPAWHNMLSAKIGMQFLKRGR